MNSCQKFIDTNSVTVNPFKKPKCTSPRPSLPLSTWNYFFCGTYLAFCIWSILQNIAS